MFILSMRKEAPAADVILDVRGEICPIPLIRAKRSVENILRIENEVSTFIVYLKKNRKDSETLDCDKSIQNMNEKRKM